MFNFGLMEKRTFFAFRYVLCYLFIFFLALLDNDSGDMTGTTERDEQRTEVPRRNQTWDVVFHDQPINPQLRQFYTSRSV